MNGARFLAPALFATALSASVAESATFGDLSGSAKPPQPPDAGLYSATPHAAGPYAASPYAPPAYGYGAGYGYSPTPPFAGAPSPSGGPEGAPPSDAPQGAPPPPNAYPPFGPYADAPRGAVRSETFSQFNSSTDPFNPWGLSTPFMFVPWTTPLSGWTNAQTWNWWRERSGAPPANW